MAEEDAAKSEEPENEDGGVIEIDENNSSVVGERRSNASVKSEVWKSLEKSEMVARSGHQSSNFMEQPVIASTKILLRFHQKSSNFV